MKYRLSVKRTETVELEVEADMLQQAFDKFHNGEAEYVCTSDEGDEDVVNVIDENDNDVTDKWFECE